MTTAPKFSGTQTIPPDLEAIRAAHRRIAPHIHRTPVMTSASLDALAGAHVYFKCENLQTTGSFKRIARMEQPGRAKLRRTDS